MLTRHVESDFHPKTYSFGHLTFNINTDRHCSYLKTIEKLKMHDKNSRIAVLKAQTAFKCFCFEIIRIELVYTYAKNRHGTRRFSWNH
jgi:hypothetical protein